jgi:ketosteroid isomerase-like protein
MPEESTTPDLVEITRFIDAASRGDIDLLMSFFAPDAVWVGSLSGIGSLQGAAAIRSFLDDWIGSYQEFEIETEEVLDVGNGVMLSVSLQKGRPVGSTGYVQLRYATVAVWVGGMIERFTTYKDIDQARAAAERLAESRG